LDHYAWVLKQRKYRSKNFYPKKQGMDDYERMLHSTSSGGEGRAKKKDFDKFGNWIEG